MRYIEHFKLAVKRYYAKKAVIYKNTTLLYGELDSITDRYATFLLNQINNSECTIIATYLSDPLETLIWVLSILKAGCAFCILDKSRSREQVYEMLNEIPGVRLISDDMFGYSNIIETKNIHVFFKKNSSYIIDARQQTDLSYIVFTSGSTGVPKGVMISDYSLVNYCMWIKKICSISEQDNSLLTSSLSFDLGYTGVFPILMYGGCLHLMNKDFYMTSSYVLEYIYANKISFIKLTPTYNSILINDSNYKTHLRFLRCIIFGGEHINKEHIDILRQNYKHLRIFNHYGPCECTIGSAAYEITNNNYSSDTPVGKSVDNGTFYILQDSNHITRDTNVVGEIILSGANVGLGYVSKRMDLENKFFKIKKLSSYRTGDVGYIDANGDLHIIGRSDRQIKIRGYRVELQEIEHYIRKLSQITSVAVISGENNIVAFYCSQSDLLANDIRKYLQEKLPDYMIPKYLVKIDKLPCLANGKIDYNNLKQRYDEWIHSDIPMHKNKSYIDYIWTKYAHLPTKNSESFFQLGGDSLSFLSMLVEIGNYYGIEMPYYTYIKEPTLEFLKSSVMNEYKKVDKGVYLTPIERSKSIKLLPAQELRLLDENYNSHIVFEWMKICEGVDNELQMRLESLAQWQPYMRARLSLREKSIVISQNDKPSIQKYKCRNKEILYNTVKKLMQPFDFESEGLIRYATIEYANNNRYFLVIKSHFVSDSLVSVLSLPEHGSIESTIKELELYPKIIPYQYDNILENHLHVFFESFRSFITCFEPETCFNNTAKIPYTFTYGGTNNIAVIGQIVGVLSYVVMHKLNIQNLPLAVFYNGRQYRSSSDTFYNSIGDFHDVYYLNINDGKNVDTVISQSVEQLIKVRYGDYSGLMSILNYLDNKPQEKELLKNCVAPMIINIVLDGGDEKNNFSQYDMDLANILSSCKISSVRYLSTLVHLNVPHKTVKGSFKCNSSFYDKLKDLQDSLDGILNEIHFK